MTPRPNDRITDNRAEFSLRFLDHERYNSPRQRRLRQEHNAKLAGRYSIICFICQAIILTATFIIFAMLMMAF